MKAVVQDSYGSPDVLHLRDVDMPVIRDDEVLVRVRAAAVHADVWHAVSGWPYVLRLMGAGLFKPKNGIPGIDLAGCVEAVGASVKGLQPGDDVFGESVGGFQWKNGGTFAEYVAVRPDSLAIKPANVTFEQAASVPSSGIIALHNLQSGGPIQPGSRVLINGAAGNVGGIAVQLAKANGAHVTGVDHADKLDLVRSLGADCVIDYTREDVTRQGERFDLIFDVASNLRLSDCKRVLTPTGKYVFIGHDHFGKATGRWLGSLPLALGMVALSTFEQHLPKPDLSMPNVAALMSDLRNHLAAGVITPVIDKTFPLSEAQQAIRYLVSGHARGRIVITV